MKYVKAKAEVIDFGKGNSFSMCTSGGNNTGGGGYSSKGDFFAQNMTNGVGAFYPYGSWPFSQFFCESFNRSGSYSVTVNGQPLTIIITPSQTPQVYDCVNYYDF